MSPDIISPVVAGQFLESMRDFGITTTDAMNEFVDNSVDANATNISITIDKDNSGSLYILVEDDGDGMAKGDLQEAIRFGGRIPGKEKEVGKFGFGLPASIFCQSNDAEIYSKKNDHYVHNRINVEELNENEGYTKDTFEDPPKEMYDFDIHDSPSDGTVIILKDLRDPEYTSIDGLERNLRRSIGRIQRYPIDNEVNIDINNKMVRIRDPLMHMENSLEVEEFDKSETWTKDTITIDIGDYSGEVTYDLKILPIKSILSKDQKTRNEWDINSKGQGLYLVRETREIKSGVSLSLYTQHGELNYFRGEIRFSKELDQAFGVQTNKSRCNLSEKLRNQLSKRLEGQIRDIRREIENRISRIRQEMNEEEGMSDSERVFNTASKWLAPSAAEMDDDEIKTQENKAREKVKELKDKIQSGKGDVEKHKNALRKHQLVLESEGSVYFKEINRPSLGTFYGSERRGKVLNTQINPQHAFYKSIYQNLDQNQRERTYFDLLLMTLSKAEDETYDDEVLEFYKKEKRNWSRILEDLIEEADYEL